MSSEKSPLLPSNASGAESSKYYFLRDENHQGGTTDAVRDGDGAPVHETLPPGSSAEEFAPRVIGSPAAVRALACPYEFVAVYSDTFFLFGQ